MFSAMTTDLKTCCGHMLLPLTLGLPTTLPIPEVTDALPTVMFVAKVTMIW